MFKKNHFRGNRHQYYSINNSMIDQVLKTGLGIPITLSLIYSAVCRRAGIKINMINAPRHFLVSYSPESENKIYYLDVFNEGVIMDINTFPPFDVTPIEPPLVWSRMLMNIYYLYKEFTRDIDTEYDLIQCMTLIRYLYLVKEVCVGNFSEIFKILKRIFDIQRPVEDIKKFHSIYYLCKEQDKANESVLKRTTKYSIGDVITTDKSKAIIMHYGVGQTYKCFVPQDRTFRLVKEGEIEKVCRPFHDNLNLWKYFDEYDTINSRYILISKNIISK